MAEAATHLTEHVLPLAPYRQFVVSFPIPLRYWLHTNKRFAAEVYAIVTKAIHRYYADKATALGTQAPAPGTISFLQRWGSALNLNPHLHIIALDGVYTRYGELARFRNLDPITDDEVATLIQAIGTKVMALCVRRGYLNKDGEQVAQPDLDPLFHDHDALALATPAPSKAPSPSAPTPAAPCAVSVVALATLRKSHSPRASAATRLTASASTPTRLSTPMLATASINLSSI